MQGRGLWARGGGQAGGPQQGRPWPPGPGVLQPLWGLTGLTERVVRQVVSDDQKPRPVGHHWVASSAWLWAVLVQGRPSRKERAAAGSCGSWLTASGSVFMPGPALSCSYREPSDHPPDKHHQDCSMSVLIIQLMFLEI